MFKKWLCTGLILALGMAWLPALVQAEELPRGVQNQLKYINRYIDNGEKRMKSSRDANSAIKMGDYYYKMADRYYKNMEKRYKGKYSPDHKDVKAVVERMANLKKAVEALKKKQLEKSGGVAPLSRSVQYQMKRISQSLDTVERFVGKNQRSADYYFKRAQKDMDGMAKRFKGQFEKHPDFLALQKRFNAVKGKLGGKAAPTKPTTTKPVTKPNTTKPATTAKSTLPEGPQKQLDKVTAALKEFDAAVAKEDKAKAKSTYNNALSQWNVLLRNFRGKFNARDPQVMATAKALRAKQGELRTLLRKKTTTTAKPAPKKEAPKFKPLRYGAKRAIRDITNHFNRSAQHLKNGKVKRAELSLKNGLMRIRGYVKDRTLDPKHPEVKQFLARCKAYYDRFQGLAKKAAAQKAAAEKAKKEAEQKKKEAIALGKKESLKWIERFKPYDHYKSPKQLKVGVTNKYDEIKKRNALFAEAQKVVDEYKKTFKGKPTTDLFIVYDRLNKTLKDYPKYFFGSIKLRHGLIERELNKKNHHLKKQNKEGMTTYNRGHRPTVYERKEEEKYEGWLARTKELVEKLGPQAAPQHMEEMKKWLVAEQQMIDTMKDWNRKNAEIILNKRILMNPDEYMPEGILAIKMRKRMLKEDIESTKDAELKKKLQASLATLPEREKKELANFKAEYDKVTANIKAFVTKKFPKAKIKKISMAASYVESSSPKMHRSLTVQVAARMPGDTFTTKWGIDVKGDYYRMFNLKLTQMEEKPAVRKWVKHPKYGKVSKLISDRVWAKEQTVSFVNQRLIGAKALELSIKKEKILILQRREMQRMKAWKYYLNKKGLTRLYKGSGSFVCMAYISKNVVYKRTTFSLEDGLVIKPEWKIARFEGNKFFVKGDDKPIAIMDGGLIKHTRTSIQFKITRFVTLGLSGWNIYKRHGGDWRKIGWIKSDGKIYQGKDSTWGKWGEVMEKDDPTKEEAMRILLVIWFFHNYPM